MYPILCMFTTHTRAIIITHCSSTCVTVLKEQLFVTSLVLYLLLKFVYLRILLFLWRLYDNKRPHVHVSCNGGTAQVSQGYFSLASSIDRLSLVFLL